MFMSGLTQTGGNAVLLEEVTGTVIVTLETGCSSAGGLQEDGRVKTSPDFIY